MCHLILMLPVLGLMAFRLWPMSIAAPVYIIILAVSLAVYYLVMQAMHRLVMTGREEILRKTGTVVEVRERRIQVRVRGEIWHAESSDRLRIGDTVSIAGIDGLVLQARRSESAAAGIASSF